MAPGTDTSTAAVQLLQMMTGYWISQGVYVAAKLGIADHLATGPIHYEYLARKTNTHALSLYRTLRALASVGVFAEINAEQFALTPMAGLLHSNVPNSMRALAIMYCEEQYRAWGDLLQSVRTGEPAFDRQFGMGVFEYFRQNPEPGAVFNEAMTNWTTQASAAVAASYDFSHVGSIVDVGGNQGTLIATILRQYPTARGILFGRLLRVGAIWWRRLSAVLCSARLGQRALCGHPGEVSPSNAGNRKVVGDRDGSAGGQ